MNTYVTDFFDEFVVAINPIIIKGNKFFDSITKQQFFIKGVAYQPRGLGVEYSDPLAQSETCKRDVKLMKELGFNVIRVYEVDNDKDHDSCMNYMAEAGIYLILDLATIKSNINRDNPQWSLSLFQSYTATVDAFSKYSNTLAFFAGNEVTNNKSNTEASPFVKAAIRDVKEYIKVNTKKSNGRVIPVGYSSNDDQAVRIPLKEYFNCGNKSEQADFYGVNLYEWCGDSTFETSGYADRTNEFTNYNIPVILSEYGCNIVTPRKFTEVSTIYGSQMTSVWSGGIVYEWSQEINSYGLVEIDKDGNAKKLQDFINLQQQFSKITIPPSDALLMDSYTQKNDESSKCPSQSENWKAATNLPPTPMKNVCECMVSSLSCVASSNVVNNQRLIDENFGLICGIVKCDDINVDISSGKYGKYSYCSPEDKLSYQFDVYFKHQRRNPLACNFKGAATIVKNENKGNCGGNKTTHDGPNIPSNNTVNSGEDKKKSDATALKNFGSFIMGIMTIFVSFINVY
ncbi:7840_t:CDS:2 [Cetraspora pellucida]|uniref:7840_t:CDS:1 n=1 Tax=Cetraspora pellucida TaxID=1433469 RepID=A0ACA9KR28_9GLOM|nr:7840_t:CDS:2 [Cetraspora pellucida]